MFAQLNFRRARLVTLTIVCILVFAGGSLGAFRHRSQKATAA